MSLIYKNIPNFLTEGECKSILDFSLENLTLKPAGVINYNKNEIKNNARKSNIVFYPYYVKFPFLLEKITKLLNDNVRIKGYSMNYETSEFQFTEYNTGDFFNWHNDVDQNQIKELKRYYSIVIQINNEYENGELEIKNTEDDIIVIEKGIGNLTIFKSDLEHKVNKITKGSRYTLVNWISLKKEINYKKTII